MKIFENIDLYKYSTMRLHSVADVMRKHPTPFLVV